MLNVQEKNFLKYILLLVIFFVIIVKNKKSEIVIGTNYIYNYENVLSGKSTIDKLIRNHIFEKCFEIDKKNQIKYGTVESIKYINKNEIEFKLKDNLIFHNGEYATSEDLEYSFKEMLKRNKKESFTQNVVSIKVVNKNSIIVTLAEMVNNFLENASKDLYLLKKKTIFSKDNKKLLIGTGPYKFFECNVLENEIILKKNEKCSLKKAIIESLKIKNITNLKKKVLGLKLREYDCIFEKTNYISNEEYSLPKTINRKGIKDIYTACYIKLNMLSDVLSNEEMRKAIFLALNNEDMINEVYEGNVSKARGIMPPNIKDNYEYFEIYSNTSDQKKAKKIINKIIEENKNLDRLVLNLKVSNSEGEIQLANYIKNTLKKIGIDITIISKNNEELTEDVENKNYQMVISKTSILKGDTKYDIWVSVLKEFKNDSTVNGIINKIKDSDKFHGNNNKNVDSDFLKEFNDLKIVFPVYFGISNFLIWNYIKEVKYDSEGIPDYTEAYIDKGEM